MIFAPFMSTTCKKQDNNKIVIYPTASAICATGVGVSFVEMEDSAANAALALAREIESHKNAAVFLSNLCGARIRMGQFAVAAGDLEGLIAETPHELVRAVRILPVFGRSLSGAGKNDTGVGDGAASSGSGVSDEPF